MIIKSKDKHGNQIEFNPKGRGARYTVNGLKKKAKKTLKVMFLHKYHRSFYLN